MPGPKGRFVCVWNYINFSVGKYLSFLPEICRILSQIQSRFLHGILGKNYFGRIFHKFYWKPRRSSTDTCEISPYFRQFYSRFVLRWKNSHKYFHMLFVPRYGGTSINRLQKKDTGMKSQYVLFRKTSFVHSRSGTYYALLLRILVWNFYQSFIIGSTEFWVRFEPQICPMGFAISFLFITARVEWKVRLCVKLFDFFRGWILIRLPWNFVAFCPKFSRDSYVKFHEKVISGEFFINFIENQGYPLPNLVKLCHTFDNFILAPYCIEKNSHKYFHMFFAPR